MEIRFGTPSPHFVTLPHNAPKISLPHCWQAGGKLFDRLHRELLWQHIRSPKRVGISLPQLSTFYF